MRARLAAFIINAQTNTDKVMIRDFGLKTKYKEIDEFGENKHLVRWDYMAAKEVALDDDGQPTGEEKETDYATWMVEVVSGAITKKRLQTLFNDYYNKQTDEKILTGYIWNDNAVWLSSENQFNYKAAYDLAVQTEGASLPVTFKFGSDDEPVYHEFTSLDELKEFYQGAMAWVNQCLAEGWKEKDGIDWAKYGVE